MIFLGKLKGNRENYIPSFALLEYRIPIAKKAISLIESNFFFSLTIKGFT